MPRFQPANRPESTLECGQKLFGRKDDGKYWQKNRRRPPEEGQNYFGKKMIGKKMKEKAAGTAGK